MQKENHKEEPSLKSRSQDDWFLLLMGLSFFLMFNPLYLLLFFVLLERWIRIPILINYFFVFSFSLMFINRDIGNSWNSGDAYANDDVLNYLEFYRHIFDLNFFKDIGLTFYSGGEPLWFVLAGIVHFLTNGNEFLVIVVSVAIPIIILHKVFYSISRDFCFNAFFFLVLYPEINHIIYHVWRYSLSLSITLLLFNSVLKNQRNSTKLSLISFSAHVSSIFSSLIIAYGSIFRNPFLTKKVLSKAFFALIFILFTSIIVLLGIYSIDYVDFDKFVYYVKSEEIITPFVYSMRHLLYLIISSFTFILSTRKVSVVLAVMGFMLLLLPFFFSISIIYERVLQLIIPIIIIGFLYEIKDYPNLKNVLLLPLFIVAINFWSKSEGELFYAYMSNGHNFNVFNGLVYNFSDLLMK